jgi:hypothetical protein
MGFDIDNYVDVAERVTLFYEKWPDGRLATYPCAAHSTDDRVCMKAEAYRTEDDRIPSTGHSWLAVPGTTGFTKGSEVENAETSAIGRAIVFLGIGAKRIASADEIKSKQGPEPALPKNAPGAKAGPQQAPEERFITDAMRKKLFASAHSVGLTDVQVKALMGLLVQKDSTHALTFSDFDRLLLAFTDPEKVALVEGMKVAAAHIAGTLGLE